MYSQQIMEFLLAMQEKSDTRHEADQLKAEARHEEMLGMREDIRTNHTKAEADPKDLLVGWKPFREEMAAMREKRDADTKS